MNVGTITKLTVQQLHYQACKQDHGIFIVGINHTVVMNLKNQVYLNIELLLQGTSLVMDTPDFPNTGAHITAHLVIWC